MKRWQRLLAPGLPGHLAAGIAGAALPLSLAPFDAWPLAVLAPAALLALLLGLPARAAAWRGWWFGCGLFGAGTSWVYVSIHDYGAAPVPLAAALTTVFCAGLGGFHAVSAWAWARWLRPRRGGIVLGFPAVWVLGEWSRSWFLTGFPWLYLGYSQTDGPLRGWAPVAGVLGIGFILVLSATALCLAVTERRRAMPLAAACVALWLAGIALDRIHWVRPQGRALGVAMVQGNVPQSVKWEPGHLESTLALYEHLSQPLWGTDIVVWPEAAIPIYFDRVTDFLARNASAAASHGSTLLLGIPTRRASDNEAGYDAFNSVAAAGVDSGLYHKRHLVPFGEYVPLEAWLRGLIAFFDMPMSDFSRGPAEQPLLTVHGARVAPFVCYEIVYPELVAASVPAADVLLTLSNDTWFGASIGPLQHLQMARMRALENGRPVIRGTNNGVTALIDHRGRVTVHGAQFTREIVSGSIQPMQGATPFARGGSWPVLAFAAIAIVLIVAAGKRRD